MATFGQKVVSYIEVQHGAGVASVTDALFIALRARGIGLSDEVIVPTYNFFTTTGTVLHVGARPVFVDIDHKTFCVDVQAAVRKISPSTHYTLPYLLLSRSL